MRNKSLFDVIETASPCSQNWDEMFGGDAVRFCHHCHKNVHDISAITRKEAKKLVARSNGNLCIRYVRRPDGRIQTAERKLYQIAGRASRLAAGVFSASLSLANLANAQTPAASPAPETQIVKINQSDNSESAEDKKDQAHTGGGAGTISGAVTDPNGAVIPGVMIKLINQETNEERVAITNEEGIYQFAGVPFAKYNLRFEGTNGFVSAIVENIEPSVNGETIINTSLSVGMNVTVGEMVMISYRSPLTQAAFEADLETIKTLLQNGADVNAKEENGLTALHAAVESGDAEIVRELLQAGAKPNARTDERRTPPMFLDSDAAPELVNLLLQYGAKVNSLDAEKISVLLSAVRNSAAPEVVQLLIHAGAKPDAADEDGATALMVAAENGDLETVKALLGAGADVNAKNSDDETALSLADSDEIREILLAYGAQEK